jgi:hypothetical protein
MALNAGVHIEGLRELNRSLKELDKQILKDLRVELVDVAEVVVHEAQSNVPVKSGRALSSIKAGADAKGAFVQGGRSTVPYYAWLDFGGVLRPTGGRRNTITREVLKKGRYLYPAIDKHFDKVTSGAVKAFEKARAKLSL